MANRIVSVKEFRDEFRREVINVCDFSQRKSKHCLGIGARQMSVGVGVEVAQAIKAKFDASGRTIEKDLLIELHTPKGIRRFVSSQLNQMAKVSLVHGANIIETLWKTFGDLIVTARPKRENVYVAKAGATDMELASLIDLRTGRLNARIKVNEDLTDIIVRGREALAGRHLGDMYAETCTAYFKSLPAAE